MRKWYCIRTQRYKEDWVAHQLREKELCEEVYLPLLRQWRKVRRQFKWTIEPLFPCYLFSRLAEYQFQTVRGTPGVTRLLSTYEDKPLEVDEHIISTLRKRSVDGCIAVKSSPIYPGEKVDIIDGPFQGLQALFQQDLKAGERVAILLDLLSSQVRAEMPRAWVCERLPVHTLLPTT